MKRKVRDYPHCDRLASRSFLKSRMTREPTPRQKSERSISESQKTATSGSSYAPMHCNKEIKLHRLTLMIDSERGFGSGIAEA